MSVRTMRLVLGVMFLMLSAVIFARDLLLPGLGAGFDPWRMNLGGILAFVFGCINLAKWYTI